MKIHLTEKALKEAVILADQYDMNTLPSDSQITHEFSTEFFEKMEELIQRSIIPDMKRYQTWWRRLAIGVAAILVLSLTTAMAVPPVREKIFEFVTEVYEQFTYIFFNGPENTGDNVALHQSIPTYIPEGFELVTEDLDGIVLLVYEKGTENIFYEQIPIKDASMHINTEGVELEELEFKGLPAKYYSNQGQQNLIWYDDEYLYIVTSTLDKNTVFKIAESTKPSQD